jgi:putative addiction module component (TIGR02574 family)
MLTDEIKKLSKSEKLLLVSELWDDIADSPDDVRLTEEQERLLDERYEHFRKNPEEGEPWNKVKERIRKML